MIPRYCKKLRKSTIKTVYYTKRGMKTHTKQRMTENFPPVRRVDKLDLCIRRCLSGACKRGFACDNGYTNGDYYQFDCGFFHLCSSRLADSQALYRIKLKKTHGERRRNGRNKKRRTHDYGDDDGDEEEEGEELCADHLL